MDADQIHGCYFADVVFPYRQGAEANVGSQRTAIELGSTVF